MLKAWFRTKSKELESRGFTLIEVLLAVSILGTTAVIIIGATVYGRQAVHTSGFYERGNMLAEEGIEASRNIRDADYANLVNGTFGIAQSGGVWNYSGASDITDIFTRSVTIASGGTNRKDITANVTWQQGTYTASTNVVTRLTNWHDVLPFLPASQKGSVDVQGNNDEFKVAVKGNYAYTVSSTASNNFHVVDISNSASPTVVATLSVSGTPADIAISGNFAYVTGDANAAEVQVVNITTPTAPVLTASVFNSPGTANARGIYIVGNNAFFCEAANAAGAEFFAVNISNPLSLTANGSFELGVDCNDVWVNGNFAYLATASDTAEVTTLNVSALPTITSASTLNLTGTIDALAIRGYDSKLFVGQDNTFWTLDLSTPSTPANSGSVGLGGIVNDIDVKAGEQIAFVGTSNTAAEFQVVNVATLATPTVSQSFNVTGNNNGFGVAYSSTFNTVVLDTSSNTQSLIIFGP